MFTTIQNAALIRTELDNIFCNVNSVNYRKQPTDFQVYVSRIGDDIKINCGDVYEHIPMKNKWWWVFTGNSWEQQVRIAQRRVFEKYYLYKKSEDIKNYEVSRL